MNVEIPDDLVAYVASAINRRAEWCRKDTGHAPDDVIALRRDADRLDEIADRMESEQDAACNALQAALRKVQP